MKRKENRRKQEKKIQKRKGNREEEIFGLETLIVSKEEANTNTKHTIQVER